jgi:hypothetical protein
MRCEEYASAIRRECDWIALTMHGNYPWQGLNESHLANALLPVISWQTPPVISTNYTVWPGHCMAACLNSLD